MKYQVSFCAKTGYLNNMLSSLFCTSEIEDLFRACVLSSAVTFLTGDHVYKTNLSTRDLGRRLRLTLSHALKHDHFKTEIH